jgi:hypothetical protein
MQFNIAWVYKLHKCLPYILKCIGRSLPKVDISHFYMVDFISQLR